MGLAYEEKNRKWNRIQCPKINSIYTQINKVDFGNVGENKLLNKNCWNHRTAI